MERRIHSNTRPKATGDIGGKPRGLDILSVLAETLTTCLGYTKAIKSSTAIASAARDNEIDHPSIQYFQQQSAVHKSPTKNWPPRNQAAKKIYVSVKQTLPVHG